MNKIILKYTILSGVIASLVELLRLSSHIASNDLTVEVLKFIAFSVVSFCAIKDFLKNIKSAKEYTYLHGVCMTFFTCFLGSIISFELNKLFVWMFSGSITTDMIRVSFNVNTIELVISISFIVPLIFIGRKDAITEDILDDEI